MTKSVRYVLIPLGLAVLLHLILWVWISYQRLMPSTASHTNPGTAVQFILAQSGPKFLPRTPVPITPLPKVVDSTSSPEGVQPKLAAKSEVPSISPLEPKVIEKSEPKPLPLPKRASQPKENNSESTKSSETKIQEKKMPVQKKSSTHTNDAKVTAALEKELKTIDRQVKVSSEKQMLSSLEKEFSSKVQKIDEQNDSSVSAISDGDVDRYKSAMITLISQHWRVPESLAEGISSQLKVRLAEDGRVLDVSIVRSSGNPALDRSAMTAVYKSSPLPMPESPRLKAQFRELNLTVSPEEKR